MKINKPKELNLMADRYGNKNITTSIPLDLYKNIKNNGLSFKELIIRGYQATTGFNNVLERLKELEEKNVKLSSKVQSLALKNFELESKLNKELNVS
jgi:hypothetical protein